MLTDHDHFGPDCPKCQAAADLTKATSGLAEAMEKLLKDGTVAGIARDARRRREEAFWEYFLKESAKNDP